LKTHILTSGRRVANGAPGDAHVELRGDRRKAAADSSVCFAL